MTPRTPLAETLGAYQRLIEAGKVRVIGASNYSGERIEEALAVSRQHGLPEYQFCSPNTTFTIARNTSATLEPVVLAKHLARSCTTVLRVAFCQANTARRPIWQEVRAAAGSRNT